MMRLSNLCVLTAAATISLAAEGRGLADEIVFKKEYGGGKVKCEIYKEDEKYIHYIDIKKKMSCGCSRDIVEKIVREDKDLINVEEFFLKKAKEAKNKSDREKAAKIAEELRKKREAAEKDKKKKEDASGERRVGKCLIKPTTEKTGIKVLRSKDTGSNELLVDPFPEEDQKPKTGTAPAKPPAKPSKTSGRRRRE